jgi:hypothetical protein
LEEVKEVDEEKEAEERCMLRIVRELRFICEPQGVRISCLRQGYGRQVLRRADPINGGLGLAAGTSRRSGRRTFVSQNTAHDSTRVIICQEETKARAKFWPWNRLACGKLRSGEQWVLGKGVDQGIEEKTHEKDVQGDREEGGGEGGAVNFLADEAGVEGDLNEDEGEFADLSQAEGDCESGSGG